MLNPMLIRVWVLYLLVTTFRTAAPGEGAGSDARMR
jgi:hypothetical protein